MIPSLRGSHGLTRRLSSSPEGPKERNLEAGLLCALALECPVGPIASHYCLKYLLPLIGLRSVQGMIDDAINVFFVQNFWCSLDVKNKWIWRYEYEQIWHIKRRRTSLFKIKCAKVQKVCHKNLLQPGVLKEGLERKAFNEQFCQSCFCSIKENIFAQLIVWQGWYHVNRKQNCSFPTYVWWAP